jgi:hypothetical protein
MNLPKPAELDQQSPIRLDGWVELGSERWREVDDNHHLTKNWVKMLMGETLFPDSLGRLWGRSKDQTMYYPLHVEYGKKKYGIRMSTKAAN